MENPEPLEDPLGRLTEAERDVYDEICRAWNEKQEYITATEIADALGGREDEIRRRITSIYKKLDIRGTEQEKRVKLLFNFCLKEKGYVAPSIEVPPLLSEEPTEPEEENLSSERPPTESEEPAETFPEEEEPSESPPEPPPPDVTIQPPGGRRDWRIIVQRVVLIVVALVIIGVLIFIIFNRNQPTTPPHTESPGSISSPSEVEGTPLPSPINNETEEPAGVLIPSPSDTAAPTSTETSIPSNTPEPSLTPTLEPTPIPPLFEDTFEDGLRDEWSIDNRDEDVIEFVNGNLIAKEPMMMMVGSEDWSNYHIQAEVSSPDCWFVHGISAIGVLASDSDNMIAFGWSDCQLALFEVIDGEWEGIPGTSRQRPGGVSFEVLDIFVEGNKVTVYDNKEKFVSYIADMDKGMVALRLDNDAQVKFFRIEQLQ